MRHRALLPLALLATSVAGIAGAQERPPESLARTSKWVVDYDRDACHLFAQFGEGDASVIARFTRYEPGDTLKPTLIGRRLRIGEVTTDVKLEYGLGAALNERAYSGTVGRTAALFFHAGRIDGPWTGSAVPVTPAQEAAVTGLTVKARSKKPFRLEFGSFGKPLEALRTCTESLVKSWGYDPQVQSQLSRRVVPLTPAQTWLRDSDYPIGALVLGQHGIVQFRLDVDATGKVAGCFVLDQTRPSTFGDLTCQIVGRRAQFQPALDSEGKPVRSYYVQAVLFRMST